MGRRLLPLLLAAAPLALALSDAECLELGFTDTLTCTNGQCCTTDCDGLDLAQLPFTSDNPGQCAQSITPDTVYIMQTSSGGVFRLGSTTIVSTCVVNIMWEDLLTGTSGTVLLRSRHNITKPETSTRAHWHLGHRSGQESPRNRKSRNQRGHFAN